MKPRVNGIPAKVFKDDKYPAACYADGQRLVGYKVNHDEMQESPVSFVTPYKTHAPVEQIEGNTTQDSRVVPTYEVEGYALKYNQLAESRSFNQTRKDMSTNLNYILRNVITGNKYLFSFLAKLSSNDTTTYRIKIQSKSGTTYSNYPQIKIINSWYKLDGVFTAIDDVFMVSQFGNTGDIHIGDIFELNDVQLIDLTDMFGAGNEPTTLEQFYATKQGKLYKDNYVPYGYGILGSGEYFENGVKKCGMIFNDGSVYPHEPLYGIGDVKDKQSTNGVKNNNTSKVVFNGTENWNFGTWGSEGKRAYVELPACKVDNGVINNLYETKKTGGWGTWFHNDRLTQFDVCMPNSYWDSINVNDVQGWKNWLASHRMEIVYQLATPTTSQSTPVELPPNLSCVNETATQVNVTTPTPQYPEEVKNVDKLNKSTPNHFDPQHLIDYGFAWDGYTFTGTLQMLQSENALELDPSKTYFLEFRVKVENPRQSTGRAMYLYVTQDGEEHNVWQRLYTEGDGWQEVSLTFSNATKLNMFLGNGGLNPVWFQRIMLSYDDMAYEPFAREQISGLDLNGMGEAKDEIIVNGKGKNLWDEEWEYGSLDNNGYPTNESGLWRTKNYIEVKNSSIYRFSTTANVGESAIAVIFYYNNDSVLGSTIYRGSSFNFQTPSDCNRIKFRSGLAYGTTYNHDICIMEYEQGMDTSYEPYLPNKVWKMKKWGKTELSNLNWNYGTDFYVRLIGMKSGNKMVGVCDKYALTTERYTEKTILLGLQNDYLFVTDSSLSTTQKPSGTLIYPLATPTWEDITETELGQKLLAMQTTPDATNIYETDIESNLKTRYYTIDEDREEQP